jgi:hypothetical protein
MICPLCNCADHELFNRDKFRHYYLCSNCELVFVPRTELISQSVEKSRYEAHENSESDPVYYTYISKIAQDLRSHLKEGDNGLDFGCGRTKLLAKLLGPFNVDSYDIFFHPDDSLLNKKYKFIIMSEVIEHLRDPALTIKNLKTLSSTFFIKTKLYPQKEEFSSWFYKRDSTHVQFFNERSFDELKFSDWKKIGDDLYMFKE